MTEEHDEGAASAVPEDVGQAAPQGDGFDEPAVAPVSAPRVRTGNPVVDEVLDGLAVLEDLPVTEHVAVFEGAQDALRRALSGAGDSRG